MRCCASPTTSTEADAPLVTEGLSKGAPQDVLNAILFREILKPLVRDLGPVAEIALGSVADDMFVRRVRR